MTNEAILSALVGEFQLTAIQVSDLALVSPHTVVAWMKPTTSVSHRRIPDGSLELLCIKLGVPSPFED